MKGDRWSYLCVNSQPKCSFVNFLLGTCWVVLTRLLRRWYLWNSLCDPMTISPGVSHYSSEWFCQDDILVHHFVCLPNMVEREWLNHSYIACPSGLKITQRFVDVSSSSSINHHAQFHVNLPADFILVLIQDLEIVLPLWKSNVLHNNVPYCPIALSTLPEDNSLRWNNTK